MRISFRATAAIIFMATCICAINAHGASATPTPQELITRLLGRKTSPQETANLCDSLVKHGDASTKAIISMWQKTYFGKRKPLIETLGRINTPASLFAIRQLMLHFYLTIDDIKNYKGFCQKVITLAQNESKEGKSFTPEARIFELLSPAGKLLFKQIAEGKGKIADMQKRLIVEELNTLLENKYFADKRYFPEINMNEEGRTLIYRMKLPPEKSFGLAPAEYVRLNRLYLEAAFPAEITKGPSHPDPKASRGSGLEAALNALAGMSVRGAEETLLSYKPNGMIVLPYLEAVSKLRGNAANERLLQFLISEEGATSVRAMEMLIKRTKDGAGNLGWALRNIVQRISMPTGKETPQHVYLNTVKVATALPEDDAVDIVAECLSSESSKLRGATLTALLSKLSLTSKPAIISGMKKSVVAAFKQKQDAQLIDAMKILQKTRNKQGIDIAAYCLDYPTRNVRLDAATALQKMTGQRLGKNPNTWKKWLAENRNKG